MTSELRKKLAPLGKIAQLKADRSVAELAAANSAREHIEKKIQTLRGEVRNALKDADDPLSLRLATEFSKMRRHQQSELQSELARCELRFKKALKLAQVDEGRRIALKKLADQAS